MPTQNDADSVSATRAQLEQAAEELHELVGSETIAHKLKWTVIDGVGGLGTQKEKCTGIKGVDFNLLGQGRDEQLFWHFWPGDINDQLACLNKAGAEFMRASWQSGRSWSRNRRWREVTKDEFSVWLGLFIAASNESRSGVALWLDPLRTPRLDTRQLRDLSFRGGPNYGRYMSLGRFKQIRHFIPSMFESSQEE
jgi:hypothetical protein